MPSAKITKYNPGKDIVAGRTASQIERAKRMAVGGKKKRCVKGKSCSATCIAANKVCLVEIPWAAAKGISKVVATIKQVQEKKIVVIPPDKVKWYKNFYADQKSSAYSSMRQAVINENKEMYEFWKNDITKLYADITAKGIIVSPPMIPTWRDSQNPVTVTKPERDKKPIKPADKGAGDKKTDSQGRPLNYTPLKELPGFVNATGTTPPLPSLRNSGEYVEVRTNTGHSWDPNHPYWKLDYLHNSMGGVLEVSGSLTKEQKDLASKMGGEGELKKALMYITEFTGTSYSDMRAAQRTNAEGKTLSEHQKGNLLMSNYVEKLISILPKERVVKFRGAGASDEKLAATIAASKAKGEHAEGALASWSTSLQKAQNFADKKPDLNQIIYVTANNKGVSVRSISLYDSEEEILTPGSAKYKHTGRYETVELKGRTYHIFYMEEL